MRIGDRERHGVRAVVRIDVSGSRAAAAAPIAEAPGVGQGVTVRIRRRAPVEADGGTLGARIRSPRGGRGWVIRGGWAPGRVVTRTAPRVGERLSRRGDELPGVTVGQERELQDAE